MINEYCENSKGIFIVRYENKAFAVEAFIFLGWARVLKSITFSKVAPSLGDYMNETPFTHIQPYRDTLKNVSYSLHLFSLM